MEVGSLGTVSLDELESRAALLRRVDRKYVLDAEQLEELAARLVGDHDILEIDGERAFAYESTYFDTPDLRCFHGHEVEVSKYRTGIAVPAADPAQAGGSERWFEVRES